MKSVLKWFGILACCVIVAAVIGVNIGKHEQKETARQVADKTVRPGMTPDQVRAAWGAPEKASKGFYGGAEIEQWTYRAPVRYVAFRDGKAVVATADAR